jgi:hypothetical protein
MNETDQVSLRGRRSEIDFPADATSTVSPLVTTAYCTVPSSKSKSERDDPPEVESTMGEPRIRT